MAVVRHAKAPGFPNVRVSTAGRVDTCWRFVGSGRGRAGRWVCTGVYRPLAVELDDQGRHRVTLTLGGRKRHWLVSRLVLEAFVGPCPTGMEACHNDGKLENNTLDNLRWDTHQGNEADKRRHGTAYHGARHHATPLTEADVASIRGSDEPTDVLALRHGVSEVTIRNIRKGRTWRG